MESIDNFEKLNIAEAELNINDLGDKFLIRTMEYLSFEEKIKVEAVCKKWQSLIKQSWSNLKKLSIDKDLLRYRLTYQMNNYIFKLLEKCGAFIENVTVKHVLTLNYQEIIKAISEYCCNISKLSLVGNLKVTDKELELIFKNNKKISKFSLFNMSIDGDCLSSISCDSITELEFHLVNIEKKNNLYDFLSKLKNLKKFYADVKENYCKTIISGLDKSNCQEITEFFLDANGESCTTELAQLLSKQKNLYELNLKNLKITNHLFDNLSDSIEIIFVSYCDRIPYSVHRLKNLTIFNCEIEIVTDDCIKGLSECTNLVEISFQEICLNSLTSKGEQYFSNFRKLKKFMFNHKEIILERISSLSYPPQLQIDNILKSIVNCKSLEILDISNGFFETASVINICALEKVQFLGLSNTLIKDKGLMEIIKNLRNLKSLHIYNCPNCSPKILKQADDIKIKRGDNECLEIFILEGSEFESDLAYYLEELHSCTLVKLANRSGKQYLVKPSNPFLNHLLDIFG